MVIRKYLGLDKIVSDLVKKLGDVQMAYVTGDYAMGKDTGIIDLLLVGEIDEKRLYRLVKKVEGIINRRIRFLIADKEEYSKMKSRLLPESTILLWGNE